MDYRTNIWHQRLVAILGSRNLYLRTVYAHIANYTVARGAWCGTQRELAAQIELPTATVNDQIDKLKTMGLVVQNGDSFVATKLPNPSAVQENTPAVQTNPSTVQMRTGAVQKNTPAVQNPTPINEIKTMEINEKNARSNMRDANPKDNPSFEELLKAFKAKAGDYQIADLVLSDARRIWSSEQYPDWKKQLLIRRINDGSWLKPRLDWTLSDFDPKPHFFSGVEQEDNWRLGIEMIQVKYNGHFLICTPQTKDDFALEYVKPWPKKED